MECSAIAEKLCKNKDDWFKIAEVKACLWQEFRGPVRKKQNNYKQLNNWRLIKNYCTERKMYAIYLILTRWEAST